MVDELAYHVSFPPDVNFTLTPYIKVDTIIFHKHGTLAPIKIIQLKKCRLTYLVTLKCKCIMR